MYKEARTECEGKMGQNFTPAKYANELTKIAMPWIEQMYNAGQYEALAQRLCRTKIFDPACGAGALLVAAWKRMSLYLDACNEKLGTNYELSKSQFYGIEIDDRFATETAKTFSRL